MATNNTVKTIMEARNKLDRGKGLNDEESKEYVKYLETEMDLSDNQPSTRVSRKINSKTHKQKKDKPRLTLRQKWDRFRSGFCLSIGLIMAFLGYGVTYIMSNDLNAEVQASGVKGFLLEAIKPYINPLESIFTGFFSQIPVFAYIVVVLLSIVVYYWFSKFWGAIVGGLMAGLMLGIHGIGGVWNCPEIQGLISYAGDMISRLL